MAIAAAACSCQLLRAGARPQRWGRQPVRHQYPAFTVSNTTCATRRQPLPKAAVVDWYTANVLPLGPQRISVTDLEITAWTWNMRGATYERTAVISFERVVADGSGITEVVRLVQDDQGTWRWFFGRDVAFVNEQTDRCVD